MKRRDFLKLPLCAGAALCLPRMALAFSARSAGTAPSVLVSLFLRGGADGLNIVVPYTDPDYYRLRPTLAVPRPGGGEGAALDLDARFGLHPAAAPLLPLYRAGELAILHACGAVHGSRSHFDAQALMERGVDDPARPQSGWLGRLVEQLPGAGSEAFLAVGIGNAVARSLIGPAPALNVQSLETFALGGAEGAWFKHSLAALYLEDGRFAHTATLTFGALEQIAGLDLQRLDPPAGVSYPATAFGSALRELGRLIRADLGLRAAAVDIGGWDHHANEAQVLPGLLSELGNALAAFRAHLGEAMRRVVVLVMSEFGRRAAQNGSGGTDHGAGNIVLVLGGGVRGGRIIADWPGLRDPDLDRGDLRVTIDYRQVLEEAVSHHFPGVDPAYVVQDLRLRRPGGLGLF
jgi:uncharacterized protein (DUF1501 family)